MAHYAFIDENNIVTEVITGKDEDDLDTLPNSFSNWEEYYSSLRGYATCKRTSYNTFGNQHNLDGIAFRGNYAGIGYIYNEENDVFYAPQPFNSWILDLETWLWVAPLPRPQETEEELANAQIYVWDEDLYQSDNTQGWVLNSY